MKRKILIGLLFLVGLALMAYPIVSGFLASENQTIAISNYKKVVEDISDEDLDKMIEETRKYNENLASSIGNEQEEVRSYADYLNVGDIMGYVEAPKAEIYLPIYHGTSKEALTKGAGHMETTSFPVGGESTHAVLAGHTGMSRAKMFDNIRALEIGDEFYIHVLNTVLTYKVDQIKVVEPSDDRDLQIEQGEDYVTLLTCTPHILNTYRLLVRGTRVEDNKIDTNENIVNNEIVVSEQEKDIPEESTVMQNQFGGINKTYIIIGIAVLFLFVIIILLVILKKNKKKAKHKKEDKK